MLNNLKESSYWSVVDWLIKSIPELTPYQKQKIDVDFVRLSKFYFFEKKEKEKIPVLWRLTLPFFVITFILFFLSLPFKMILTGTWTYDHKKLTWLRDWAYKLRIW